MSSIGENLMLAVEGRLTGSPAIAATLKRAHRTPVTKAAAPTVHLIDGADTPKAAKNCRTDREKEFTVSVFVRSDAGAAAADPLVVEVNARLDPESEAYAAYPHDATLTQGPVTPDEEIADGDATRIDMRFTFRYQASGWALDA